MTSQVESDGEGGFKLKEGSGVSNNIQLETPIIFSPDELRLGLAQRAQVTGDGRTATAALS